MESSSAESAPLEEKPPGNDTFAHIAQKVGGGAGGLVENYPEVLPDVALPCGAFQSAHDFPTLPRASTAEEMREELAQLREEFAPFLKDFGSHREERRRKFPVRQAQWRLAGKGDGRLPAPESSGWQTVNIPHYGGPIGPAVAFYRHELELPERVTTQERLFLCFRGADYRAEVYLNGSFLTRHEGFFEPFEVDVTEVARPGRNELLVRLENDYIGHGNEAWGQKGNGEKLYAATGLGWDEPGLGWHHCPPGMGLCQEVYFETRSAVHVHDLWVRPVPLENRAELHVVVRNSLDAPAPASCTFALSGSNFPESISSGRVDWEAIEPGLNAFRIDLALPQFRWWTPETPWLYKVLLEAFDDKGAPLDTALSRFGMRTFEITETGPEKGRILLNGREIRLRGANTMGHEQQCVLHGNLAQLHDDILIAKHAGLNFLRLTQRPVEQEIYDACDRLGMMVQTDLPLFAKVPRSQFAEGVRQAGAMERLIRGHAACVLVSFINEPFPLSWGDTTHRHMKRAELEGFLRACSEIVRYENPDRQIKPVDGDYDPPAPGLPDNHCYCGWYAGHALDLGKLHRGHWVPTKPGWRYACGEFGSEGLDSPDLMRRRYPASWLPLGPEDASWTPSRIARAQTGPMHGLWMDTEDSLEGWVNTSQEHQAWITRLMTRAFRRDRRMSSFAIHLLIDAFPAGWMKTLVDCERNPKPAYFAYRDALAPLLVDIRLDRWAWWSEETLSAEIWICHDGQEAPADSELRYVLEVDGHPVASGCTPAAIPDCSSFCQGIVNISLPPVSRRTNASLRAAIVSAHGQILNTSEERITLFPRTTKASARPGVFLWEPKDEVAGRFVEGLGQLRQTTRAPRPGEVIVSSKAEIFPIIEPQIAAGATLLLLELLPGHYEIAGDKVTIEAAGFGPRHFVSRATGHPAVQGCEKNDFRFWHDPAEDAATALLDTVFFADGWKPVLTTSQAGWGIEGHKKALACAEREIGRGRVIICQVKIAGRTSTNPPAEILLDRLLG
ncbi:MAG: hypothetical protein BGO12_16270 [Verrucomicrobia bacterium 61-8]|nr:hypothetical protein [Verrucomicrobiota bacterium]OJU98799.1 MAG: hypothetical protein BGO12_16270 [Verrucomicrobia bacterium 61-8]